MSAKPLKNDCFALPAGVDWTPVREALDTLRGRMHCVVGAEFVPTHSASGRILASPAISTRAHPPFANSAVDGYGFAHASVTSATAELPLQNGRAAAGVPYQGVVESGNALRILTGAAIPSGVDTIILEEDVEVEDNVITFSAGLKLGANCRPAGEDIEDATLLLSPGHKLTAGDIGMLASVGVAEVEVRTQLRVGILSTGDEVVPLGASAGSSKIYDANRPMLAAILESWGYQVVDLGHVGDDPVAVRDALDKGAATADAVLSTGGASAGDEDHVSATLQDGGDFNIWRIAIKPGRPLAMSMWGGVPVFGLPGNPVAAFVCTLVFARPSLAVLAGAPWSEPQGTVLSAKFSKSKKRGRSEYLRARKSGNEVEIFASEGSGRVSGLSWANGLVVLGPEAREISPGDPVQFISFAEFGL